MIKVGLLDDLLGPSHPSIPLIPESSEETMGGADGQKLPIGEAGGQKLPILGALRQPPPQLKNQKLYSKKKKKL